MNCSSSTCTDVLYYQTPSFKALSHTKGCLPITSLHVPGTVLTPREQTKQKVSMHPKVQRKLVCWTTWEGHLAHEKAMQKTATKGRCGHKIPSRRRNVKCLPSNVLSLNIGRGCEELDTGELCSLIICFLQENISFKRSTGTK